MKKIILAAITVCTFSLASQAQFKVGIKGGATFNHQNVDIPGDNRYSDDNLGASYHAGIITDIHLGGNFYLQPQVLFSRKEATYLSADWDNEMDVKVSYLEVPVNLLYKFDVSIGKLFVGAGGTFSYAIAGKQIQDGISTKLFRGNANDWRREDVSANFTTGLELNNGLAISLGVQQGLLDVYKKQGGTVRNTSYSLSVAYLIDWKRLRGKG